MKLSPIPLATNLSSGHVSDPDDRFAMSRRLQVPIWVFDVDNHKILLANETACVLWQAEDEQELCARNLGTDMSQTVINRLKQYQAAFLESDRMAMQCEAVSEANQTPQNLRSAEALLYTDVMISLFTRDGPPLYQNPAAQTAFPSSLGNLADLFVDPDVYHRLLSRVEMLGEFNIVTKMKTSDGSRWIDLTGKNCSDAATGQPAILLTAFDVSALKEARDLAQRLANHDQLTNLHNRAYLQSYFEALTENANSDECAAIYFDVDRFKLINDRHGHAAGDAVLQHIARQCRAIVGSKDLVARVGGDEFVVIFTGAKNRSVLNARIADLKLAISRPILHKQALVEVGISIGAATFSPKLSSFEGVLRKADLALCASKDRGRNQVTYFTEEMGEASRSREQIESELKLAIKHENFVLYYQPRLDIRTNTIVGAEGLVRWMHPTRSLVADRQLHGRKRDWSWRYRSMSLPASLVTKASSVHFGILPKCRASLSEKLSWKSPRTP